MRKDVSVIILYDEERRILLQHRTNDAPIFPGYWAFFGGGVEEDELPEQCARREAIEELAYCLTNPVLVAIQRFSFQGNRYTMHVFVQNYDGTALVLGEGQGMGWFLASETKDLLMNDHDRLVIEMIRRWLEG